MINTEDVYFLTYLGKSELDAAGTSLSRSELKLLVLIDGKATVSQLQASAGTLTPAEVRTILEALLRSEHIALQQFDMGDFFGASAADESKTEMPSDSAIESGVATLRQDGYAVRIARRPPEDRKLTRNKKLTVVVVEDETQLADNMRIVLTHAGFVVRVAANREQIVAAFRQAPLPDLVLLDVTLPDADGFEVLAKIRLNPVLREVPVIMVTGAATREAVVKGLRGDANGYVTKPFQISVLVKAVKTVLGIGAGEPVAAGSRSAADAARPAAEPVAAAPPAPQLADTEAYNASPGSLLARLREAALAKQKEEQKPAQKERHIPLVSKAVEITYRHLKEVAALLDSAKPAYAQAYTFNGLPNFDDLKWDSIHLDFRTREVSPTSKAFEQVTLHYRLAANKVLQVVRETPADEKLKQALFDAKIEFDTREERNERGSVVGTAFTIPCAVKASLRLVGNFKTGKLALKMRNVEHFGALEYMLSPEAITDDSLNELSRFIIGESRRIGPLLLKSA